MRNVLSLFNGMSCLNIALERAGLEFDKYYSAEIDKYAIQVTQDNYPDTIQLGDVTKWREWDIDWSSVDLVTGGFPCQAWSMAGKQLGDKDERGMLFWTMLDIMKHVREHNPDAHFLIENVKMKREFEEYITHHTEEALGDVHKILINSALVSAQNRNRYYWASFECTQPDDKGIVLADIIENGVTINDKSFCIDANYFKGGNLKSFFEKNRRQLVFCDKSQTLLATIYKENAKSMVKRNKRGLLVALNVKDFNQHTEGGLHYRKLTPIECERLQTVPDNYTSCVSNTQRYKMLGNGWTVDVITHLLIDMVVHG